MGQRSGPLIRKGKFGQREQIQGERLVKIRVMLTQVKELCCHKSPGTRRWAWNRSLPCTSRVSTALQVP